MRVLIPTKLRRPLCQKRTLTLLIFSLALLFYQFRYALVIVRGLDFGKVLSDAQHFVRAKAPVPWVCARRACGYRRGAFQLIVRDELRRTDIADGAHRVQSWQRDADLKSEACQAIGRIISPNG